MGRAEMNEDVFATGLRYLQPPSLILPLFFKESSFRHLYVGESSVVNVSDFSRLEEGKAGETPE